MLQNGIVENRSGPRYVHASPIRAEWDTHEGAHIVAEGETENVGLDRTLALSQRELPPVGARVSLRVLSYHGETLADDDQVLRTEGIPATRTGGSETGTSDPFDVVPPPQVTTTDPASAAIDVPLNKTIAITFNRSVSATTSSFTIECPAGSGARGGGSTRLYRDVPSPWRDTRA